MHIFKIASSFVVGAIMASAAPTTVVGGYMVSASPTNAISGDAAPAPSETFTSFAQERHADIIEGWHEVKDHVLHPFAGEVSFIWKIQNVSSIEDKAKLWFSTFHGGEASLLTGYPAELDQYVLGFLQYGYSCSHNQTQTECEKVADRAFDDFEHGPLLHQIKKHERLENETASSADIQGFSPRSVSRDDMWEILKDNTAFDNILDDQITAMRNFLAEPVHGFARKTFGRACDGHPERSGPKDCQQSSLLQLAERWAKMYPHEDKIADPREDWLTLFDIFTWWNETMEVVDNTVRTMPFREVVEDWEKTYPRLRSLPLPWIFDRPTWPWWRFPDLPLTEGSASA